MAISQLPNLPQWMGVSALLGIFSHLTYFIRGEPNHMRLIGDSRLVIVAGSDTTAATLTHLFYYIAQDPSHTETLGKELKPLTQPDGTFDNKDLMNTNYLGGMINEALRLHPPVPSGLSRQTPAEGIMIGEMQVPGDIIVSVPLWSVGRCEFPDFIS